MSNSVLIGKKSLKEYFLDSKCIELLIFGIVFCVYGYCSSQYLAPEDDGLFILASNDWGVGHPPGYPLFIMLGKLFSYIPIGTEAYRIHMLSAFFGAAACAVLYRILRLFEVSEVVAAIFSFALGFSKMFWAFSIVAEVYSFNAFLFSIMLYMLLNLWKQRLELSTGQIQKRIIILSFIFGLSLSNHWPLIILSSPAFLLLFPNIRCINFKLLFLSLLAAILGLAPYLIMVIRSNMDIDISFYGAIDSFEKFLFFVSRKGYNSIESNYYIGIEDKVGFLISYFKGIAEQFTVITAFFAFIGFFSLWKLFSKRVALSIAYVFFATGVLLIFILNFDFNTFYVTTFSYYPALTYVALCIFAGVGVDAFIKFLSQKLRRDYNYNLLALPLAVIIFIQIYSFWGGNNRREYNWAETFGRTILNNLPESAVLFLDSDYDLCVIKYLQKYRKIREDVFLLSDAGLVLNSRLFSPFETKAEDRDAFLENTSRVQKKPVFFIKPPFSEGVTNMWIFSKVNKDKSLNEIIVPEKFIEFYLKEVVDMQDDDLWGWDHKYKLKMRMARIVGCNIINNQNLDGQLDKIMPTLSDKFETNIEIIRGMIRCNGENMSMQLLHDFLTRASRSKKQYFDKGDLIDYLNFWGIYYSRMGDKAEAKAFYERSLLVFPGEHNPASRLINEIEM